MKAFRHTHGLVEDLCATDGCTNKPVQGTLHCDPCWIEIEQDEWGDDFELRRDAAIEREVDAMRDEERR